MFSARRERNRLLKSVGDTRTAWSNAALMTAKGTGTSTHERFQYWRHVLAKIELARADKDCTLKAELEREYNQGVFLP